jgi:DNA polymerase-3 subunit gamma/tau
MSESRDDYRVKYRPRRYDQMWQGLDDPTISALREQEIQVRYPTGLVYCGDYGCGKTTAARIRGMRTSCWNYERDPVEPCGECRGCRDAMTCAEEGPDYFELDATMEKLRLIIDRALNRTGTGKRNSHPHMPRVFFIDEAHRAPYKTQLTLLRDIKEHQESIFILSTREPDKLEPRIRDACEFFFFKPPPVEKVVARLEDIARQEGLTLEPGVAARIAERKQCVPRDCLGALYELTFTGKEIKLADVDLVLGDEA